jgi:hypothetical protein
MDDIDGKLEICANCKSFNRRGLMDHTKGTCNFNIHFVQDHQDPQFYSGVSEVVLMWVLETQQCRAFERAADADGPDTRCIKPDPECITPSAKTD